MAWTVPWNLIGMEVSGDVGDYTIYTNRFQKKVAFPKAPPKEPPSELQIIQRASFKAAQKSWMDLTDQEKTNLENATKKLSMPLTGQNLWISALLKSDFQAYLTVQNQSGIILPELTN